ncbi:UNVERIFIED_CONTAM: hypothetical protein RMT77_004918 [Armadillidium vulgare]
MGKPRGWRKKLAKNLSARRRLPHESSPIPSPPPSPHPLSSPPLSPTPLSLPPLSNSPKPSTSGLHKFSSNITDNSEVQILSSPNRSTSGEILLSSTQSSIDESFSPPTSKTAISHSTPYFPRKKSSSLGDKSKKRGDGAKSKKMSDETLERVLDQTTLDEDWGFSSEGEDEESLYEPISPIPKHQKALDNLINKCKKNLNFEEIDKCLNELPSFTEEVSEVREMEREYEFDIVDAQVLNLSSEAEPSQKRSSTFSFYIPENNAGNEQFEYLFSSYKDAIKTLLNIDIPEEKDAEPEENPNPTEHRDVFDRTQHFNLEYTIEGFEQLTTSEDSAIIQIKKLNDLQTKMGNLCKFCELPKVEYSLRKTEREFFRKTLEGRCLSCRKLLGVVPVHERMKIPQAKGGTKETDIIGLRLSIGAMETGIGYTALHKLMSKINLPTISLAQFHINLENSLAVIEQLVEKMKDQAADIVKRHYISIGTEYQEGLMNIEVSFDGTWLTRGYGSLIGLGFVVDVETGIILDYHILSKYCNSCTQFKRKKHLNEEEKQAWKEQHKEKCLANHEKEKSSSSMEGKIAEVLFARSKERGLRYTTILSDEDSSTFNKLQKLNPYGESFPITKQNCLNHINKKIYRRLDKLQTTQHLGGKGKGKLTQNTATIFANFYRNFVKKFYDDKTLLKKNIFASVFHHAATDKYPFHQLCPIGPDSWCQFQKDIFNKVPIPGTWHDNKNNRKYSLGEDAAKAVLEVMISMTSDEVLNLVSRKTQNMNESLHSKVWSIIPKSKFRGIKQVQYATATVSLIHNCGEKAANILQCLGIDSGVHLEKREEKQTKLREKVKRDGKKRKRSAKKYDKKEYNPGDFAHDK